MNPRVINLIFLSVAQKLARYFNDSKESVILKESCHAMFAVLCSYTSCYTCPFFEDCFCL